MYYSPVSIESDDSRWLTNLPKDKKTKQKEKNRKKNSNNSACMSISSADSGWFSSDGDENNKETESLLSPSRSFDSSYEFGYPLETINESSIKGGRRKKKNNLKVRTLGRYASNSWKNAARIKPTVPESESPVKKSIFRQLMIPCVADGKVMNESFVVVKSSEDPYEDFKRSMEEMRYKREIFECKDLEQLLQCFFVFEFKTPSSIYS